MGNVSEFNRALSMWFNEHGISNLEFTEGEDFCYYVEEHVVQWGVFTEERIDNQFMQFMHEYGLKYDVPVSIISLIHEVGHYMTIHYFDDKALADNTAEKNSRLGDGTIETNYWYWELPIEFAANMWAIEWINNNYKAVKELWKMIKEYSDRIFSDPDILDQLAEWIADTKNGDYYPLYLED